MPISGYPEGFREANSDLSPGQGRSIQAGFNLGRQDRHFLCDPPRGDVVPTYRLNIARFVPHPQATISHSHVLSYLSLPWDGGLQG